MSGFKDIICGTGMPDAYGYKSGAFPCQRRKGHVGKHTRKFEDGWRVWGARDRESTPVSSLK